jgi:hypothetical protein
VGVVDSPHCKSFFPCASFEDFPKKEIKEGTKKERKRE